MKKNEEENLVKQTCRELGINQKQLAEKIGITPEALSRWSRGSVISKNSQVLLETLIKLSKYEKFIPQLKDMRNNIDKLIIN